MNDMGIRRGLEGTGLFGEVAVTLGNIGGRTVDGLLLEARSDHMGGMDILQLALTRPGPTVMRPDHAAFRYDSDAQGLAWLHDTAIRMVDAARRSTRWERLRDAVVETVGNVEDAHAYDAAAGLFVSSRRAGVVTLLDLGGDHGYVLTCDRTGETWRYDTAGEAARKLRGLLEAAA